MPRALDVGAQVPHAAVRAYVMGERAQEDATQSDLLRIREIVLESLHAGALGFSTGRTRGHRDVRGNPVPGTFAAQEELEVLFGALAEAGHGVFQLVPSGIGGIEGGDPEGSMDLELDWMIRLGLSAPVPITYLVMESRLDPDGWRPWFERTREANNLGARLRPQVASRCFGVLIGHQSRMNPFRYGETFARLSNLPLADLVSRLREPELRAAILAETPNANARSTSLDRLDPTVFEHLFPLGEKLEYEPSPDQSVAAIAARSGSDPWEVVYDLMLGAGGKEFLLRPLLNYARGSYDGLHDMICDPMTVQGLGDGGAHSAIVCDASMTTYLLTDWVRDRTRGPRIPLELAVRRLTNDPADLYNLGDRGVLRSGMRADVNLIEFDRLALCYPEQVTDLPANAGRLVQGSEGYVATLVDGEIVVDQGELTDARPGRLVRCSSK